MDAKHYNGADERGMSSTRGNAERYRCLSCAWVGKGMIQRVRHVNETGHLVVYDEDPRPSHQPQQRTA